MRGLVQWLQNDTPMVWALLVGPLTGFLASWAGGIFIDVPEQATSFLEGYFYSMSNALVVTLVGFGLVLVGTTVISVADAVQEHRDAPPAP